MGYRLENKLPSFLMKDTQQERISCFMSFAKDGKHLRRYIDKYMKVKMIEHIENSNYSSLIEEYKNKNVIIKEIDLE